MKTSKPFLVYRWEHPVTGWGPYRNNEWDPKEICWRALQGHETDICTALAGCSVHPGPYRDAVAPLDITVNMTALRFGFRDVKQADEWFPEPVKAILQSRKYVFRTCEAKRVFYGIHQVAFLPLVLTPGGEDAANVV